MVSPKVRPDQIPLQPKGLSTAEILEKVSLQRVNSMRQQPPAGIPPAAAAPPQLGPPVCGPLQSAPAALQTMSRLSVQEVPNVALQSMPSGPLLCAYQGMTSVGQAFTSQGAGGSLAVPSWPAPCVGGSMLASSRAGTQRLPPQRPEVSLFGGSLTASPSHLTRAPPQQALSYGGSACASATPVPRPPAQSLSYNPMTPKSRTPSFQAQAPSRSPYPSAGGGISGARMRAGGLQDYDLQPREVRGTGMDALGPPPGGLGRGIGARFGADFAWGSSRMPW